MTLLKSMGCSFHLDLPQQSVVLFGCEDENKNDVGFCTIADTTSRAYNKMSPTRKNDSVCKLTLGVISCLFSDCPFPAIYLRLHYPHTQWCGIM